ncbi:hypothetical protein K1T71_003217 [Dendrolimus kikuchii]|uniref:Uncharacterized protein n=1 Tax=Dendrolimus kikuchii TaxID=765133 RepID=A0ACC1DCH6_9NEOP|nr:hypothetical protein K1T71_003217 [Dendrolimus kikuchii]
MRIVIFTIYISLASITPAKALEPKDAAEDDIKQIINKYIRKIPDIESRYVIDEGLSQAISHYFNGKLHTFPLYKISLKLDRNPVKIPWTLGEPDKEAIGKKIIYRYVPRKKLPEIKTA